MLKFGQTRFVILWGDKAIKIGRCRPLRALARLLLLTVSEKQRKRYREKYGAVFHEAFLHDVFAGVYANTVEYRYYQLSRDSRVMPTVHLLCGGWVAIQKRGTAIKKNEMREAPAIPHELGGEFCDTPYIKQYCRTTNGRVVLIDYGRPVVWAVLFQTLKS